MSPSSRKDGQWSTVAFALQVHKYSQGADPPGPTRFARGLESRKVERTDGKCKSNARPIHLQVEHSSRRCQVRSDQAVCTCLQVANAAKETSGGGRGCEKLMLATVFFVQQKVRGQSARPRAQIARAWMLFLNVSGLGAKYLYVVLSKYLPKCASTCVQRYKQAYYSN